MTSLSVAKLRFERQYTECCRLAVQQPRPNPVDIEWLRQAATSSVHDRRTSRDLENDIQQTTLTQQQQLTEPVQTEVTSISSSSRVVPVVSAAASQCNLAKDSPNHVNVETQVSAASTVDVGVQWEPPGDDEISVGAPRLTVQQCEELTRELIDSEELQRLMLRRIAKEKWKKMCADFTGRIERQRADEMAAARERADHVESTCRGRKAKCNMSLQWLKQHAVPQHVNASAATDITSSSQT